MIRKGVLLLLALLFAFGAHLRVHWDYEVAGRRVAADCNAPAGRLAIEAASRAAEEILPGAESLPALRRRLSLKLTLPKRSAPELTDAILRATDGVCVRETVFAGERYLGAVSDAAAFEAELTRYLANTLPAWASGGALSAPLRIERRYGRPGYAATPEDMVLLVTGAAPVLYTDGNGVSAAA